MREELVTASAIVCGGVVTRLCAFIPDPAPARLIRLAGLSLKNQTWYQHDAIGSRVQHLQT
jgi:hypothetical protein